jgi:hypothetical protein
MSEDQPLEQISPEYTIENNQLVTYAQKRFYDSDRCREARKLLQALVDSPEYSTTPSSPTGESVSFVERHLIHLSAHPRTDLDGYMSNLRLMTNRKREG